MSFNSSVLFLNSFLASAGCCFQVYQLISFSLISRNVQITNDERKGTATVKCLFKRCVIQNISFSPTKGLAVFFLFSCVGRALNKTKKTANTVTC